MVIEFSGECIRLRSNFVLDGISFKQRVNCINGNGAIVDFLNRSVGGGDSLNRYGDVIGSAAYPD